MPHVFQFAVNPASLFMFYVLCPPSFCVSLLVVGGAALPLAGVVHARRADGAGDEVSGAGGHEVSHCRRDVHPLVCHQVICTAERGQLCHSASDMGHG